MTLHAISSKLNLMEFDLNLFELNSHSTKVNSMNGLRLNWMEFKFNQNGVQIDGKGIEIFVIRNEKDLGFESKGF